MLDREFPVALIVNDSAELAATAGTFLKSEGYKVVVETLGRMRRDPRKLLDTFLGHNPRLVLFDVPPPVSQNWTMFQELYKADEDLTRRYVVTTASKNELSGEIDRLVQDGRQVQLVGQYNIDELVGSIRPSVGEIEYRSGAA